MSMSDTPVVIKQEPKDSDSDWAPDVSSEVLAAIKMEIMEVKKEIKSEPVEEDNKDGIIDKEDEEKISNKSTHKPTAFRKVYNSRAFYRGHKRRHRTRHHPTEQLPPVVQRPDPIATDDGVRSKEDYFVCFTNIPQNWSYDDLWGLLKRFQCDLTLVKRLSMDGPSESATKCVKVYVVSLDACFRVKDKLLTANVDGKKLNIYCHYIDSNGETTDSDDTVSTAGPTSKRCKKNPKSWRPDVDVHETDPAGLYGLKAEFLRTLKITPPIDRWVQVSNFRCGKRELEEIMCLAGDVLIINMVYNQAPKAANVMYKHPLEAVQAVSMLNDQSHYSNKLTVKMATNMSLLSLPEGLKHVGPGLGAYGKPLRDIVSHYERFVKRQSNRIDKSAFQSLDTVFAFDDDEHLKKKKPVASETSNVNNEAVTNNVNAGTNTEAMETQTVNNNDGSQSEMQNENSNQDVDMANDTQGNTQSDVGHENSQDTDQNSQNIDDNLKDSLNTQNDHDQYSQNAEDSSQNDTLDGTDRNSPESNSDTRQFVVVKPNRKTSYRGDDGADGSDSDNSVELVPSSIAHEIVELDGEESDLDQPDSDQNENVPKSSQGSNNTSRSNSTQNTPSVSPNLQQNCSKSIQNSGPNNSQNMSVGPTNDGENRPQFGLLQSKYVPTPIMRPSDQQMPGPGQMRPSGPNFGLTMGPNHNQMRMNVPGPMGPTITSESCPQLQNPMSGPRPIYDAVSVPGPNFSPMISNPMRGPGPNQGQMIPNPMRGSGPIQGPMMPNPMRGPGPNQGPMMPNLMPGPGPNQGPMMPNPMRGPGPNQGLMVPNPMSSQMRQFRPNPNQMIGPNPMSMNMPGPNRQMNVLGPSPARMGGPIGMAGSNGTSDTVRLSNLPLSTTFPLLSDKMGECGQVMSLQLTSPGCAVVRFASNAQAVNCWQRYNNFMIQGNKVSVSYI